MEMSVDDLLRVETLTGLIETFGDETREKFFTGAFEKGEQLRPDGELVKWDEVQNPRGLAPVVGPESEFPRVDNTKLIPRSSAMLNIKLHTDISAHRLFKQRAPGKNVADAYAVIRHELKGLRMRLNKTIEKACCDTLNGRLHVDLAANNYTGSTMPVDVDYTGKIQTFTSSADWSTTSTLISSTDIPTFSDTYTGASGLEPATSIMNVSVEKQLRANTDVQNWTKNQRYAPNILEAPIITSKLLSGLEFGGLEWRKSTGYYTDASNTATKFMPDNRLFILPEDALLSQVLGMAIGTGFVPQDVYGPEGQINFIEAAAGFYAFSEVVKNGPLVRLYAGWIGLPYLKYPKGVMVVNTHGS